MNNPSDYTEKLNAITPAELATSMEDAIYRLLQEFGFFNQSLKFLPMVFRQSKSK